MLYNYIYRFKLLTNKTEVSMVVKIAPCHSEGYDSNSDQIFEHVKTWSQHVSTIHTKQCYFLIIYC
jgi:hypothetical protein